MDFLNQFPSRLATTWRRLPQVFRVAFVVVAAASVATVGYWHQFGERHDREWLFGGAEFTTNDLARMEAAFGRARLAGARIDGRKLGVPAAQKDLYLKALVDHQALPDTFYSAHERALDRDHPFTSQRQREGWMKMAREQEAALIVRKIRGIEEVCVQYDDVDTGEFPRRKRRRATVAVRAVEGRQLEHETVQAIRSSVMTAVGVAQADDITVLDLNAGRAYDGGGEDAMRQAESDYAAAKRRHEENYQAKIRERLATYPGAIVSVNVELDRPDQEGAAAGPLVPREVSASISLPRSALVELWRRERPHFSPNAARAPEAFELRKIEDSVRGQIRRSIAPLLAAGADPDEADEAAIAVDTFADQTSPAESAPLGALAWHASLVDKEWMIGLGILAFAACAWTASRRGARHDGQAEDGDAEYATARRDGTAAGRLRIVRVPGALEDDEHAELGATRGERLRGELTDRVKVDPRSAAETVKQWLGNVA